MKSINYIITVAIVTVVVYGQKTESLKILGIFPLASSSHFIPGGQLLKGLARKGHEVDVISHYPLKKSIPNYRDISLRGLAPMTTNNLTYEMIKNVTSLSMYHFSYMTGTQVCGLLSTPVMENFIKNTPKGTYDVIIVELFGAQCYLGFGEYLNAPIVGMVLSKFHDWLYGPFGVPLNTAYIPSLFSSFSQQMTFWERLHNTFMTSQIILEINYYFEGQKELVETHFGRKLSSIRDLYNDVSIILLNSHSSIYDILPVPPAVVEIGGLHVHDDQQELSPEIKKWCDESKDGFIYFSFGSMVRIETYPTKTLKAFYEMFERIAPVRVLLKIADPTLLPPGLPANVITLSWLPQVAVLKHPNVKLFITHGGLMGTQESIAYGVPMLGIPIFGDQHTNMQMYMRHKIAMTLLHDDITSDSLTHAVITIIHKDPSYRENSKRIAKLFLDRPMTALDTAIYWVEYAARNGPILKSPATELTWWQYYLIDVYGFVLICVLFTLLTVRLFLKFIWRLVCRNKNIDNKSPSVTRAKKNK